MRDNSIKVSVLYLAALILIFAFAPVSSAHAKSQKQTTIKVCGGGNIKSLRKRLVNYEKIIARYSKKYGVAEALIKAVITAESCFNSRAVSPKGAVGLMQLMPATAKRFGTRNRKDPDANIKAGTRYLKFLMKHFDEYLVNVIAAYNAGEGAVNKYKGVPPYRETRNYVAKVSALYQLYRRGVDVTSVFKAGKIRAGKYSYAVFKPMALPRSQFSPYKGRLRNIARGNCANRTGTRLRKATKLRSGKHVWQRVYTAKKGDTLAKVMNKTGVHKNRIKQMNRLRTRSKLRQGQKLLLWECRK